MQQIIGYVCGPRIYEFDGWLFEWSNYGGPWPLKSNGDPRERAGRKFWKMIEKFQALPKAEQIKCNVGGGCIPLVKKQTC